MIRKNRVPRVKATPDSPKDFIEFIVRTLGGMRRTENLKQQRVNPFVELRENPARLEAPIKVRLWQLQLNQE